MAGNRIHSQGKENLVHLIRSKPEQLTEKTLRILLSVQAKNWSDKALVFSGLI
jgi:hypothetical protein